MKKSHVAIVRFIRISRTRSIVLPGAGPGGRTTDPADTCALDQEGTAMPKLLSKLEQFLSGGSTAKWE
jgi:hypothetical protein